LEVSAKPLSPREPTVIIRTGLAAVLKYQVDTTAFSRPEGLIVASPSLIRGVAVREVLEGTGVASSLIE